ncbi:MAG TPA: phosphatidylserine decarboxylase [Verrucomicrobiae bacterium]|nr:phosphatidylserine decarboxylase [Verrucomicrobiae bacterium]
MKHSGKAALAALRIFGWSLAGLLALFAAAAIGKYVGTFILQYLTGALVLVWALFAAFVWYFFRDPDPMTPTGRDLVISPGHGKVDVIDTTTEAEFMGGPCRRISIFLSVFNVHVQNAPVTGRVAFFKHTPGQYLNAMRCDCAQFNENVLVGIDCFEPRNEKVGVRLIAGLIARRIVPWLVENDPVQRGERISLIQFGSRVDVYLPMRATVKVELGQKVVGGETVIASFD